MPVVVVIIIVAAWAVLLGPSLVKRRARGGGNQSITHFHYQLRVLEQQAPEPIVSPAYRLRSVDDSGAPTTIHYPDTGRPPVLTVVGAKELPRPALAFLGEPEAEAAGPDTVRRRTDRPGAGCDDGYDEYGYDPAPADHRHVPVATMAPRAPEAYTRAQARRRRRDTLAVLGCRLRRHPAGRRWSPAPRSSGPSWPSTAWPSAPTSPSWSTCAGWPWSAR